MTFVLRIDKDDSQKFSYVWTVTNARITDGQLTRVLTVIADDPGVTVTVSLTVEGADLSCDRTVSETAGVQQEIPNCATDEFGDLPYDDQRGRFDLLFAELSNNPDTTALLTLQIPEKNFEKVSTERLEFILGHIKFRELDKSRFVFLIEKGDRLNTRIYRFYKAIPPDLICDGCKVIWGSDLK